MDKDQGHGERIRSAILAAGVALWRDDPTTVTARRIGRTVGLSHSAVLYHYRDAQGLRMAIADHAVAIGDTVVVPMLITAKHPAAAKLTGCERDRYLAGC